MATLDATGILPTSSVGSQQGQAGQSQSEADWDIDDADEIQPGEGSQPEEVAGGLPDESSASEWDLDDGWETNVPIAVAVPSVAATPAKIEGVGMPKEGWHPEDDAAQVAEEAAIDNSETTSLVADSDPEAVVETNPEDGDSFIDAAIGFELGEDQPLSESTSEEAQPSAGEPTEVTSDDILAEIADAERECERAAAVVEALKARSKEAKTDLDAAVSKLRRLAREVANDSERPIVVKPAAAKSAPAPATEEAADPDDDEDDDEFNDEDGTDLEDYGDDHSESISGGSTRRGNPTRIRITQEDEQFPQLLLNSEHAVTAFEEEGEPGEGIVTIDDPDNPEKELFLSPAEYEAVAWEELPVSSATVVAGKIEPNSAAASQAKANEKNSRPEDDSWRQSSLLNDVGLPPNLAALLEGNPEKTLKTMGDVQDWTANGNNLSDIPKIGPAKVTQLEDAFEKFWAKWNAKK